MGKEGEGGGRRKEGMREGRKNVVREERRERKRNEGREKKVKKEESN